LPAKYWLTNQLTENDIIKDGFYDVGYRGISSHHSTPFPSIKRLNQEPVSKRREIILVDAWNDVGLIQTVEKLATELISTYNLKPLDPLSYPVNYPTDMGTTPKEAKEPVKEVKEKETKEKEKDKDKDGREKEAKESANKDATTNAVRRKSAFISFPSNPLVPLAQNPLGNLVNVTPEVICTVASLVCKHMGGPIDAAHVNELAFKFRITEEKLKFKSNVIPITSITVGTFYHRALFFKLLMDWLCYGPGSAHRGPNFGCTLIRGEYGRAWNTLKVKRTQLPEAYFETADSTTKVRLVTATTHHTQTAVPDPLGHQAVLANHEYVNVLVDLMFEPGRLLRIGSIEAQMYQRYA
jgi:hypothetical protein